ncbi:hypothetical protein [Rhodothermus marinus]|nr:hypothetical protein [Rhodothermus marinus]
MPDSMCVSISTGMASMPSVVLLQTRLSMDGNVFFEKDTEAAPV